MTYCEDLTLDGFSDWRLPAVNELLTLVDYSKANPAIDGAAFPGKHWSGYWSSTSKSHNTPVAWYVSFDSGGISGSNKTDSKNVRCVRSGPVSGWALGAVVIFSPAQAATLITGTTQTISWEAKGQGGQMVISLSREGGKDGTWEVISDGTANDGSFDWQVTGPASVNCVLKVEPIADPTKAGFQGLFSIASRDSASTTPTKI